MKYQLPWGSLPDRYRVGENFDSTIVLYRGEKASKISRDLGILSTALTSGVNSMVYEVGDTCETGDEIAIGQLINPHVTGHASRNGNPTPFVSATPWRNMAETFASGDDEVVVEIEVPVNRILSGQISRRPGHLPDEILVVGGILPDEIKSVDSEEYPRIKK